MELFADVGTILASIGNEFNVLNWLVLLLPISRTKMLKNKRSIAVGIFIVFILVVVMEGIRDNKARAIISSSGLSPKTEAISDADSEISFMCVKDDDVFVVRMARSMARKREGRWYLPGHGQCSYHHWQ